MTNAELICWKCGASLAEVLLPFPRLSKCKACNVDLHVCRMCKYYDTTVSDSCREPIAEKVNDKKRANFCGYFQPRENAKDDKNQTLTSEAALESLFGLEQGSSNLPTNDEDKAKQNLDALFGLNEKK
jgi:hypothetical protein